MVPSSVSAADGDRHLGAAELVEQSASDGLPVMSTWKLLRVLAIGSWLG